MSKKITKIKTTDKIQKKSVANFATNKNQAKESFAKKIQYSHNAANGRLCGFTRR
jgi:hypothetical protein